MTEKSNPRSLTSDNLLRNRAFDGLRALAVLLVLVFHANWNVPLVQRGGAAGVDIFFVLSGFLITRILRKELKTSNRINWVRFCLGRMIRLWPALVTSVTLSLLLGIVAHLKIELLLQNAFFGATFTYVWFSGFLNGEELAFGHLWTLSIEQSFYLAFPLALGILFRLKASRAQIMWGCLVTGSIMLIGTSIAGFLWPHADGPGGFWGYARAGGLLLGAGIAVLQEKSRQDSRRTFGYLGATLLIASLALAGNVKFVGLSFLVASVGSAFLTYAFSSAQGLGIVGRLFSSKLLVYIGVISYEIYLWHWPLLSIGATASGETLQLAACWGYPLAIILAAITHYLWTPAQKKLRLKLSSWLS